MNIQYFIIFIVGLNSHTIFAQKENVHTLNGDFGLEICSDSTVLNCWEYYFNEKGVTGFFKLDSFNKPLMEKGFFMISNPLFYKQMKELYDIYILGKDSIRFKNSFSNLNLAMHYEWMQEQISIFVSDSNICGYTYNEFIKPLKRKRIQKKIFKLINEQQIGASIMTSYSELTPTMLFFKKTLEIEYLTTDIVVERSLFTPNLSNRVLICNKSIPIHIVLSIREVR